MSFLKNLLRNWMGGGYYGGHHAGPRPGHQGYGRGGHYRPEPQGGRLSTVRASLAGRARAAPRARRRSRPVPSSARNAGGRVPLNSGGDSSLQSMRARGRVWHVSGFTGRRIGSL